MSQDIIASVIRGVQQARNGELENFPSFAEFVSESSEESSEKPATKRGR